MILRFLTIGVGQFIGGGSNKVQVYAAVKRKLRDCRPCCINPVFWVLFTPAFMRVANLHLCEGRKYDILSIIKQQCLNAGSSKIDS